MARTLIFNILLVITFEVFMVLTLKMPLYQKVLMGKILVVSFLTILFQTLF